MKNESLFYEEYKDNFNYYNLITKINPFYKLYFDKKNKCFIIANSAKNNQICLKFNSFSIDLLKILSKSRIENSKKIFEEIDVFNENLKQNYIKKTSQKANDKLIDFLNFSHRVSNVSPNEVQKILGE